MSEATPSRRSAPSRRGLTEYLLLVGFLVIAAAGAVALFGDEIREAFGLPAAAAPAAQATAPPR